MGGSGRMTELVELSNFIDAQKNFIMTLIAVLVGFYCTVAPVPSEYGGQGVGLAIAAVGVYTGHRIEAGKSGNLTTTEFVGAPLKEP